MRRPHLHSAGGNFPHRAVEVEFDPFSGPQLARANESQGEQFERSPCFEAPFIILDGAQQSAEGLGRYDGRARRHCWRYQRAAQCDSRIVLGTRGGNRVTEYVPDRRSQFAGGFVRPTCLDLLEDG